MQKNRFITIFTVATIFSNIALVNAEQVDPGDELGEVSVPTAKYINDWNAEATRTAVEVDRWILQHPQLESRQTLVTIPVWVKIFYDRDTGKGKLSYNQVLDQIQWLNYSYSGGQDNETPRVNTRFRFELKGYNNIPVESRSVNVSQTRGGDGSTYPARTQRLMREHHNGGVGTLNVYVAKLEGIEGFKIFGVSTAPRYAGAHPEVDGIWVARGTWRNTPGAGGRFSFQGDTLVHELGHWIGALPDYRSDNCSLSQHNFMWYVSDKCMRQFTRPQARLMSNAWTRYRD
jgi:hypothetical protein